MMALKVGAVVVDAVHPARLAAFWSEALGYDLHGDEDGWMWITDPSGRGVRLSFQYESLPKTASNRLHLDLYADDADAEVERLLRIGASVKREYREPEETVIVMQDPEGNEFCVCGKSQSTVPDAELQKL